MAPIFESNFSIRSILSNGEDNKPPMQTDTDIRPNYTYGALVTMAIRSSPEQKLTLSGIQQWIADNFPYYRKDQRGWQCQIRHTLTTNSCFMKIPRPPSDPGRGNYWTLNPEVESIKNNAAHGQVQLGANGAVAFDSKLSVDQAMAQGVPHPQIPTARYFPTPQEIERTQQVMMTQALQEQHEWYLYHQRQMQLAQQQLRSLQQHQFQHQCEEIYNKISFHQQQCSFFTAPHYPNSGLNF
ncbi:fork head domain transcription factor slp1-like [Bactrocera neohumeralis]|uniref:fork head domain transcription factor slp1-like n=1 Tax=Bactrocera neohumeralis TaxID=98809 RepID=UPI002164F998|nr:fork head domain transcription factor slp1-like [Bactrocera neohumeralis]